MPHIFQHYSYTKTLSYSQIADQTGLVLGPLVAALWLNIWAWYWVVMWVAGFVRAGRPEHAGMAASQQHHT